MKDVAIFIIVRVNFFQNIFCRSFAFRMLCGTGAGELVIKKNLG
jgi:hypothetical protein